MAPWECERKFVVTASALPRFVALLERHTALHVLHPERPITYNRTTYLDTDDLAYLRSASAPGIARKLRVREYAAAAREDATPTLVGCFLELKQSGNGQRAKTRVAVEPAPLAALLSGAPGCTLQALRGEDDPCATLLRTLLETERPSPKLTTWYRRITRVSEEPRVRITIDSGLCFAKPLAIGGAPSGTTLDAAVARVPFAIVEVKSAGDVPDLLLEDLAHLQEVRNFSKYAQGMAHLLGDAT